MKHFVLMHTHIQVSPIPLPSTSFLPKTPILITFSPTQLSKTLDTRWIMQQKPKTYEMKENKSW